MITRAFYTKAKLSGEDEESDFLVIGESQAGLIAVKMGEDKQVIHIDSSRTRVIFQRFYRE